MHKNIFGWWIFIFLFAGKLIYAQNQPITVVMPDTAVLAGDTLVFPVTVSDFEKVVSLQFSMKWDAEVIEFVAFERVDLNNIEAGVTQAANGSLRISWFPQSGESETLPDLSTLFLLKFLPKGEVGDQTPVEITNQPIAIQVVKASDIPGVFNFVALEDGTGSVTIIDGAGEIRLSFVKGNNDCAGDEDGFIDLRIQSGGAPYTVQWQGPEGFSSTEEDIFGLKSGDYELIVRDALGEIAIQDVFTVREPEPALEIEDIRLEHADCSKPNGTATIFGEGGVPPYRFDIGDGPSFDRTFLSLAATNYTVTITDATGCTASSTFEILNEGALSVSLGDDQTICEGTSTTLTAGNFSSYRWSNGSAARSISVDMAGSYSLTVTDQNGCSASDTVVINQIDAFKLDFEEENLMICPGAQTQLSVSGADSYRWIDTSRTLSNTNVRNPIARPRFTSAYQVIAAGNCGADTATFIVTVNEPEGSAGPDTCISRGERTTFAASGGVSYRWLPNKYPVSNPAIADPVARPEETSTYMVVITDRNGCESTESVEVFVADPARVIETREGLSICEGETQVLTGGSWDSYRWSTGSTERTIEITTPGDYSLTVSSNEGCVLSETITVEKTNNFELPVDEESLIICPTTSIELEPGSAETYEWIDTSGTLSQTNVANPIAKPQYPTTYQVIATSSCGVDTATFNIALYNVDVSVGPDTCIGFGQDVQLSAQGGVSYNWLPHDFPVSDPNSARPTAQPESTTTYTVEIIDQNGCSSNETVQVAVASASEVVINSQDKVSLCRDETKILAGGDFETYLWSTGSTDRAIEVNAAGEYTLTVTNSEGCILSKSVLVEEIDVFQLNVEIEDLVICPDTEIELAVEGADTYEWIDTSGTLSQINVAAPIAKPDYFTVYQVVGTTNCGIDTATFFVDIYEVDVSAGPDTCIGNGVELELGASGGASYNWLPNNYPVSDPNIANPFVQPEETTTYSVLITDENGCQILDSLQVITITDPEDVRMINLITPNGDGKNDILEFPGITKFGTNTLRVYNRWGDLVFQKVNYMSDEERFDGSFKGEDLPVGNYYYVLSFRTKQFKQTLTLVRE